MNQRFQIWQCTDECCAERPMSLRWWNFRQIEPTFVGGVYSEDTLAKALRAVNGMLRERKWMR